ncbi:MAG: hypothetical protein IJ629_07060 [Clostridia bacterium]|nr:hypothetical protein [Clostridia bacterium]
MKKMSIERFLELKKWLAEVLEIFLEVEAGKEVEKEKLEKLEQEIEEVFNEIHTSDLSDIPAESYDGFIDLVFDFEGTGAKLDFNFINESYRDSVIRARGCEIFHFDFETIRFDEDSFDEEFIEQHKERFWGMSGETIYPKEVRTRYHLKRLTLEDVIQYNLVGKVEEDRLDWSVQEILKVLPVDVIKQIDVSLYQLVRFNFRQKQRELKIEKVSSMEEYELIMKAALIERFEEGYNSEEDYEKIALSSDARKYIPEYIIDFPPEEETKMRILRGSLSYIDIQENLSIFQGKKFMHFMTFRNKAITEEQIIYLFKMYPEFSSDILLFPNYIEKVAEKIDVQKTVEENAIEIKKIVRELYRGAYTTDDGKMALKRMYGVLEFSQDLKEYEAKRFQTILKYTTPEKIESYDIPYEILGNIDVIYAFERFGFETLMEFDKENGNPLTKNNYAVLINLYEHYIHYDGNNHNPRTNILSAKKYDWEKEDDYQRPFTKEEFEEAIIRIIKQGYGQNPEIDYRDFSAGFKARHPEMFLSEEAPAELQDLFYSRKLTVDILAEHEDWVKYVSQTDYSFGIKVNNLTVITDSMEYYYTSLVEYISHHYEREEGLRFLLKNREYIRFAGGLKRTDLSTCSIDIRGNKTSLEEIEESIKQIIRQNFFPNVENADLYMEEVVKFNPEFIEKIIIDTTLTTREEIRESIEIQILQKMKTGEIKYASYDFGKEFKEKYSEMFIDDNAPEELKEKFYTRYREDKVNLKKFGFEDLMNPEYRKFIIGKRIPNAFASLRNLLNEFSVEELIQFGEIDLEGLTLYGSNQENAVILKHAIQKFPNKIKEIISMPGLILYGPEEITEISFREYQNLLENNSLRNSVSQEDFRRDLFEQILGHMYGFLGFNEAKKMLETPEIDPESLQQVYEIDGRIKDLYEKKFEITGNIKILTILLNGFPGLLPGAEKLTSKSNLDLFKTLNRLIQEGYQGDIRSLLSQVLEANHQPDNTEEIENLVQKVISMNTEIKLEKLREFTSAKVETEILENTKTRKRIKEIYRAALKYSLNQSEKVDINLVREYLEKEFARIKENGEPFYSPHVTEHLEDLLRITEELNLDPEKSRIANQTLVDCLKEEAEKIGKRWIMKIVATINCPEKMTYEEAVSLDEAIYGKDSIFEVETKESVGLKDLTEEEKRRIYEILGNAQYAKMLTFNKAEIMFSGLTRPYSEEFRNFFLLHKEEFIAKPEFYTIFGKMHQKFERIIRDSGIRTRFEEGLFTLQDLVNEVNKNSYENVGKGEHELEYIARKAGLTQEQFVIAQRLYREMQKREAITIPPEEYKGKRFRGRIVRIDDPLHLAIGEITNCCQTIGLHDPGESSMIHSATEQNGSLFVVEEMDEYGKPLRIVAQSWTWRNGNRITFDNVEIPASVRAELEAVGGFDEIMEVYEQAALKMIQTDRRALDKLLQAGKITEAQYRSALIKDVAMGKGCDDLIIGLSNEMRRKHPDFSPIVTPLEINKRYTGASEKSLYTDSRGSIVLIAHNDEFDENDHTPQFLEVADIGIRYTKTRDIWRRNGSDIDEDKVEMIQALVQKTGRSQNSIFANAKFIQDIIYGLNPDGYLSQEINLDNYQIAMSSSGDWYIFSEETENGVIIHDSGIDTELPENATDRERINKKMALAEYTKEMLELIQISANNGKKIMLDIEREGKILMLNSLVENGEIELSEDGVITVLDIEKLRRRIEQLSSIMEEIREDRMVADVGEER